MRESCIGESCPHEFGVALRSFEVLTKGLPQVHAYDLTYRHALDVDEAADRLAFGTTTGSLWVSENQGDSWEAVSEHLPPVYCVRFA